MKSWQLLSNKKITNIKDLINILLKNRGLAGKKEIEAFLNPPKPQDLKLADLEIDSRQVKKAIGRIKEAKKNKETVVVYTDYDVDGVSGGTIIWEILHKMGIQVMPYIPHREKEGYGLSKEGIDATIKDHHPKLIITVDHGITGGKHIKYARKLGIDIIIIDHHVKNNSPSGQSPAYAVIHSTQLCATGVAWIFARELYSHVDSYLDLVALATVADLVPLLGPNRSLVKYGLVRLNQTTRIGLKVLIKAAGLEEGKIGIYEIGHILAPRINSMGRLLHALDAMRLLCTPDENRAIMLAQKLNSTNKNRQTLTEDTILHAHNLYSKIKTTKKLIFIAHESYNQGIIGLVAGKLVESYYRPTIVVSKGEIYSKASARSISGFNIIETIRSASELLVNSGGHPMAAGFTVKTEYIEVLQKKLEEIVEKELKVELLTNTLKIDSVIDLSDITRGLLEILNQLQPHGIGNPLPLFMSEKVQVDNIRLIGKDGKHLKLLLSTTSGKSLEAVGWNLSKLYDQISRAKNINIVYTVEENNWNGRTNLQLNIKDVKIAKID